MDEESDKWELLQARRRRKQQQSARDALQREEERKLVQEYLAYLQQKKFQQQQQRQQLLCRVRAKPQTAEKEEEKPPPKEPIVPAVREIPRVRLPRPRQAQKELPENVATLYGKFKGPLMLKYLKELEASDKVTAWRLNEILSLPNEAECESERTDRDKADWIDVGGPVSRQGAWTPCAVDVAVSNANCAARFSSLCQDAKTIESCCAEQVLAQVTAEIDMCKAPPPTNKCDGLYGAEGLQCAWEEDAKSCVEQSCKGCGGEQCQLCRADAQRIAGCCDDHYHSVDPPQICKDSKEEAVTSCMDSKCRGCGGEQCQLCREDAKSECCTGAMRTPSCESK
ncbi:unnamed protein product, partial [Effrenium voratum]